MIEFKIILLILLIHWLADFCLQTNEQALGKSTDEDQLTFHVATYSLVWFFVSYCLFDNWNKALIFGLVTYVCHFWTDFFTSRVGKSYWDRKDFHNGFVIVGFDQILHYLQLFLTYIWLSK